MSGIRPCYAFTPAISCVCVGVYLGVLTSLAGCRYHSPHTCSAARAVRVPTGVDQWRRGGLGGPGAKHTAGKAGRVIINAHSPNTSPCPALDLDAVHVALTAPYYRTPPLNSIGRPSGPLNAAFSLLFPRTSLD